MTATWQRSAWAARSESIKEFDISLCRCTGTKVLTPLLLTPIGGTNRLYPVSNSQNAPSEVMVRTLNRSTLRKKSPASHWSGFLSAGIPGALYRAAHSDLV